MSLAFGAGIVLDRAWLRSHPASIAPSRSGPTRLPDRLRSSTPESDDLHVSKAATLPQPNSNMIGSSPSPKATDSARSESASNADPSQSLLNELFDPEEEARTRHAIGTPLPTGTKAEVHHSDGSIEEHFASDDGTHAFKHLNRRGQVLKDGWATPSGESFYRTYYNSGHPKLVSINRVNGTQTTLTFNDDGTLDTRFDQRSEDASISVTYDLSGKIREIWQISRDGKSVRTYPEK